MTISEIITNDYFIGALSCLCFGIAISFVMWCFRRQDERNLNDWEKNIND